MKNKFLLPLYLCSLFFAALLSLKISTSDHFVAASDTGGGISVKSIEEINSPALPLSYKTKNERSVRALFSDFSAAVKATNHSYKDVMNFQVISGNFFSKAEFENKANAAVLNLKAAFDMFGTSDAVNNKIEIDGKPWRIVGVIDDKDSKNRSVFLPAAFSEKNIEKIFINLSQSGGLPEEQIIAKLKAAGINERDYDFINLRRIKEQSIKLLFAVPEIILFFILLSLIKNTVLKIKSNNENLKVLRSKFYLSDIISKTALPFCAKKHSLKHERRTVLAFILFILLLALQISALLFLFLDLSEKFLLASDLFSTYAENLFRLY